MLSYAITVHHTQHCFSRHLLLQISDDSKSEDYLQVQKMANVHIDIAKQFSAACAYQKGESIYC